VAIHFRWRLNFSAGSGRCGAKRRICNGGTSKRQFDAKAQQQVLFNSMLEGCCCSTATAGFTLPTARSRNSSD